MCTRVCVAVAFLVLLPLNAVAQSTDRLSLDRYLDFEDVAEPQVSPDGSQIIYARQWIDKVNDQRESALWIMDADGSRNRFLVDGAGAHWSPDGDRIAYTASGDPGGPRSLSAGWMPRVR